MEDLSAALSSRATYAGRLFEGVTCLFRRARFGGIFLSVVRRAFGCWHRHISRPFTLRGRTYEICFDCGKELPYSLELMSRVKEMDFAATED